MGLGTCHYYHRRRFLCLGCLCLLGVLYDPQGASSANEIVPTQILACFNNLVRIGTEYLLCVCHCVASDGGLPLCRHHFSYYDRLAIERVWNRLGFWNYYGRYVGKHNPPNSATVLPSYTLWRLVLWG